MRTSSVIITCALLAFFLTGSKAYAGPFYDPCRQSASRAQSATYRLSFAQSNVDRVTENFYRSQDEVAMRLSLYQAAAEQAYANYQASVSIANSYGAGCAFSLFFRGGWGCFAGAIQNGIVTRAVASAAYRSAVSRRDSYAVYSQGYVRRQAERVNAERARYNDAAAYYNSTVTNFNQCRASYPCPPDAGAQCAYIVY